MNVEARHLTMTASEIEAEKPKPRRGNAHPNFVPKADLRQQLIDTQSDVRRQKQARLTERRRHAVVVALFLALFAADLAIHAVNGLLP